jgi:hypothetical protein
MSEIAMLQNKRRMIWMLVWLAMVSALWALNVEVTYEHNARRMPTDLPLRHRLAVFNWRT